MIIPFDGRQVSTIPAEYFKIKWVQPNLVGKICHPLVRIGLRYFQKVNPTVPICSAGPEVPMYGRKRAPRPAEEVKIKLSDNVLRLRAVGAGGPEGHMPPNFWQIR